MTRTTKYIAVRVAIGLLIGMGMFYFKSAHAAACTPAQLSAGLSDTYTVTAVNNTNLSPGTCPTNCTVGQKFGVRTGLYGCYTTGTQCSGTNGVWTVAARAGDGNAGTNSGNVAWDLSKNGGGGLGLQVNVAYGLTCAASCTAGQLIGTGSTSGSSPLSGGVCSNGCIATPSATGGSVEVDIGGTKGFSTGTATTEWRLTGASCPTSPTPPTFKQSPTCVGLACAVAGPSADAKATANNTTINNTQNIYTHGDGSASVNSNLPSPPGPNGGESGVPATVTTSYTVNVNGQPITYNYYTTTTINNSYNGDGSLGDSGSPSDADGDGDASSGGDPVVPPDQPQEDECTGEDCEEEGEDVTPFAPPVAPENVFTDGTAEIAAKRQELSQAFEQIRTEAGALFGGINGGAGSLPAYSIPTVCCGTINIDMNDHADKIAFLGLLLIFITLILAAFIIMGGD